MPRFQATAITHRKDNPIFYASVASGMECFTTSGSFAEAVFYDIGNRIRSGLVQNANVLDGMHGYAGVVVQVEKRAKGDDEFVKTLILAAFVASNILQMVIVVDEDINIHSAEDVIWALTTRVDPKEDIIAFGLGETVTAQDSSPGRTGRMGKIGFDATVPFENKFKFARKQHPQVDLEKWFTKQEVEKVRAQQNEYARFIAENRF